MLMGKSRTVFTVVLGIALAFASQHLARASENQTRAGQNQAATGAAGQSADGEKDIRDVGEAGGGGRLSGEMKPLDAKKQPPAEEPKSMEATPKSR